MLIVGAKGFAKEVLEVLHQQGPLPTIAFYDDMSADVPDFLFDRFPILKTPDEARSFLAKGDGAFTLGIGNPSTRRLLYQKFIALGGTFTSTVSPKAILGHYGTRFGEGCNIMSGSVLTNDIRLGIGVLVNLNCTVGHDCQIGDFTELCPGVHLSGNCILEDDVFVGTGAVILPGIKIGRGAKVGAGATVVKNVEPHTTVLGNPAKPKPLG